MEETSEEMFERIQTIKQLNDYLYNSIKDKITDETIFDYRISLYDDKASLVEFNDTKTICWNKNDGWYIQIMPNGCEDIDYLMAIQYVIKNGEVFDYHFLTDEELFGLFNFANNIINYEL